MPTHLIRPVAPHGVTVRQSNGLKWLLPLGNLITHR